MIVFFFFNDTATTEIYTLSLHDALPICSADEVRDPPFGETPCHADPRRPHRDPAQPGPLHLLADREGVRFRAAAEPGEAGDRKSTRLNSSHANISYAVFCLKKKTIHTLH